MGAVIMRTGKDDIEVKINKIQQQTKSYLDEIKKIVSQRTIPDNANSISYFTSSLNISHEAGQESLCLGSYHIRNIGNQPLTNLHICIKLPEDSPFSFSGKYVYEHFKQSLRGASGWERINDKTSKEEFWLRYLDKTTIEPNETISFSNFQIRWSPGVSYEGSIMGVTYCDQLKEGIDVINPINLNGIGFSQEVENE